MKKIKRVLAIAVAAAALLGGGAASAQVSAVATQTAPLPTAATYAAVLPKCEHTTLYAAGTMYARRVPTTPASNRNCRLVQGDTYPGAVKTLQRALGGCEGFYRGDMDGSFGPMTKAALQDFQSVFAPPADGWYGPKTHNKIRFPSNILTTGGYVCNRDSAI